ncbi:MAG: hypothetical protein AB7P76_09790 [Candidatus Melainabacteria bacterium]
MGSITTDHHHEQPESAMTASSRLMSGLSRATRETLGLTPNRERTLTAIEIVQLMDDRMKTNRENPAHDPKEDLCDAVMMELSKLFRKRMMDPATDVEAVHSAIRQTELYKDYQYAGLDSLAVIRASIRHLLRKPGV